MNSSDWLVLTIGKSVSLSRKNRSSLKVDLNTSLSGDVLSLLVGSLSRDDFLLTLGLSDVLDSDVNSLLDNSSVNLLVDSDSNGGLGQVEDNTSSTMVMLVRHTLVDGRVSEDINIITDLDAHEVLGEVWVSVFAEFLGEHLTGSGSLTEGMWHLELVVVLGGG